VVFKNNLTQGEGKMEQRQLNEMKTEISSEGFLKSPQRKALIERWNKHIPATVKGDYNKYVMACLYENQLNELRSFKERHMIGENTTSANTAPFVKYTFPLLRRVWPALIAPEIVSVQPMTSPVGAIFYFELKYGTTKGSVTAGNKLVKDFNKYYSSELVDGEAVSLAASTSQSFTLGFTPVRASTVSIATSVSGVGPFVDNGSGALSGPGLTSGTINYTTGAVALTLAGSPGSGQTATSTYQYNMEGNSQVPQVNMDITLVSVTAKSRKLKALWSSEASDDLKALHGVDAEQELVSGMGSELALEIDREIIEDLKAGATGGTASFDLGAIPSGMKQRDYIVQMLTQMTLLSNQIGKNTLRGPANFAVMSYDLAAYVEQLGLDGFFRPVFAGNTDALAAAESPQQWGVMKFGTLQQRWTCYKDPYLTASKMILGYKGNSFIDAGYVFAPYIPLQSSATFLDPADFVMRKGLRTRYAKCFARGEFFGLLNVSNVAGITPGTFGQVIPSF